MTDNVYYQSSIPASPPHTTVVATDDVSGAQYQRVKLDMGGDGVTDPVVETLPVSSDTPELRVSRTSLWRGNAAENVFILGRRTLGWSSTSIYGDCAAYLNTSQALTNAVSSATTYYIRSTSTEDVNTTGTGAWKVRIVYLDTAGDQQAKEVTMNGQTAVSLGDGHSYFQWMEVSEVGSNQTAVGQINIGTVNGAQTVSSTVECILAGGNRSMSGRYKVPTGYRAFLSGWGSYAISTSLDVKLRATVFADDRTLSTVFHFQDSAYLASGANSINDLPYLRCPAGSEIKVSAIPANAPAGNRLDTHFHILLVAV